MAITLFNSNKNKSAKATSGNGSEATIWIEQKQGNVIFHVGYDKNGLEERMEYMIPNMVNMDLEILIQKAADFNNELKFRNVTIASATVALDKVFIQHEFLEFPKLAKKEIIHSRDQSLMELYPKYPNDYVIVMNETPTKNGYIEDNYLLKKSEYEKIIFFIKQTGIRVINMIDLSEALTGARFNDQSIIIAIESQNTVVMVKSDNKVKAYIPINTGYSIFRESTTEAQAYFKQLDDLYDRCSYLLPEDAKVYIYFDKETNSLEQQMLYNAAFPANFIIEKTTFHELIKACVRPKLVFPMDIQL